MGRLSTFIAPVILLASASAAQAQIYWEPPKLGGKPMTANEPGFGVVLPDATPTETKAALVWSLRSGLNVAALQCGFDSNLRTESNYNAIINDHKAELTSSFNILMAYFRRTAKSVPAGQKAFDTYGGRLYSSFSAVQGQLQFCTAASSLGKRTLAAKPGTLAMVAQDHLRSLYNGINAKEGDQFYRRPWLATKPSSPNWDPKCWKADAYQTACNLR